MKKLICFAAILLFLSSCSYREVERMELATAAALNISSSSLLIDNKGKPVLLSAKTGDIAHALDRMSVSRSGELYLGHMQAIVISNARASGDISQLIDYLKRSSDIRLSMALIVSSSENAASEIEGDGSSLAKAAAQSSSRGMSVDMPLYRFISDTDETGIDGVLPLISDGDVAGAALFKDYSLKKILPPELVYCLNACRGAAQRVTITTPQSAFALHEATVKITPIIKHGRLFCDISISAKASVIRHAFISLLDSSTRAQLEQLCAKSIYDDMSAFLKIMQLSRCDSIGIERELYRSERKLWLANKNGFDELLKNAVFTISSDVTVTDGGRAIEERLRHE